MSQTINRRDMDFLIYEMLNIERLCEREYFSDHGRDVFEPLLDTAEAIAYDHFLACADAGDKQPAEVVDGEVRMIPEAKIASDNMFEAGFVAASQVNEYGGLSILWVEKL